MISTSPACLAGAFPKSLSAQYVAGFSVGGLLPLMNVQRSNDQRPIAFLFPAFPVLHQTFVLWEVLALRRAGVPIVLYSIKRPGKGTQQPEGAELTSEVRYLPRALSLPVLYANAVTFFRHPLRYAGVGLRLVREWWRDRRVANLWRTGSSSADRLEMLTVRERVEMVFNASPLLYLLKSLWLILLSVYLGRELRKAGIERVHAHWASYPTTMALVVRWLFGIPFSFTAHAYDIYLVPRLLPVKVRSAEFVVTCAGVNAKYLSELAGRQGRVILNYHGVDVDRFRSRDRPPAGQDPPTLVTCGRLQLYKGHHVLLEACARMSRPARCVVIGEGPQRTNFERLAEALGIAGRVEFTGPIPQEEVARRYAGADLFVLASVVIETTGRRDVIPNVLAEAMAMAVPVVSTSISGIGELVTDGETGRLVPPGDPDALAAVLDELLGDAAQRERLAMAGCRKVRADFDRAKNIRELVDLFGRPLPRHPEM